MFGVIERASSRAGYQISVCRARSAREGSSNWTVVTPTGYGPKGIPVVSRISSGEVDMARRWRLAWGGPGWEKPLARLERPRNRSTREGIELLPRGFLQGRW